MKGCEKIDKKKRALTVLVSAVYIFILIFSIFFIAAEANHSCCVKDSCPICCQQGLEFIWEGHKYPDDYPAVNSNIEVTGVFETYDENGITYCHLISNDVNVVDA